MTVTSETVVTTVLDSALLRADLEALLVALRSAEDALDLFDPDPPPDGDDWADYQRFKARWEKVLERADLLRQSYSLAKARAVMQEQGVGK